MYDQEKLYDIVEALVEVGEAHGVSAARVALAWLLARPAVTSLIVGARTEEQLADNLAAAELTLADDELARLDQVSAKPLGYPFWHQAKRQASRGSHCAAAVRARPVLCATPLALRLALQLAVRWLRHRLARSGLAPSSTRS